MITIGVTGGIGSGKTTVARMLAAKGAALIDADQVGHRSYARGTPVYQRLVDAFGRDILDERGEIDRMRLGRRVFADPTERERLNTIVWPEMARMMAEELAALRTQGTALAVLEAAVLIEADWTPLVDEVWVVVAEPETVIGRLEKKGMPREQAEARIHSQLSNDERRRHADLVIENNGSVEELGVEVDRLWEVLRRRVAAARPSAGKAGS